MSGIMAPNVKQRGGDEHRKLQFGNRLVITPLGFNFRLPPEQVLLSIEENVLKHFKTVGLAGRKYAALLREAAGSGIQGGTVYDALLLKSATKAGADSIYTLNLKHFQAIAPPDAVDKLSAPWICYSIEYNKQLIPAL